MKQDSNKPEKDRLQDITDQAAGIGPERSAIIDHIYQVAVDPERYETLLDLWEEKIAPFRRKNALAESSSYFEDNEIENHAERAGIFLDRLEDSGLDTMLRSLVGAIDPAAAFILNQDMRFLAVNDSAASIFGATHSGMLSDTTLESPHVEKLTLEAKDILHSPSGKTSLIRFRSTENNRTIVFRLKKLELPGSNPPMVLAVSSELAWPEALGPTMQEAFGLTAAEAEIVRAVTEGASIKEIAATRFRSPDTVKTQLRSALAKTETHTQSELVRLTLSLMDVVSATELQASTARTLLGSSLALEPREFRTLKRRDGSRTDHLVLGNENGRPLLYFPLDYGLTRWPASAESWAKENNIRVIVPIRPGYGHSDNVRHYSELLDVVMEDTVQLLDHYKVKSCPVVCMSADAFFAYHLNARHPGRLNAILNCSPGFPMFLPQQYERMEKWHRFILANARYAPSVLPFLVKAGFSLARRIGKRGFVQAVYGNSRADITAFEQPEVFEAMVTGSEVCLSDWHSAHRGFSNEVIIQQVDWSHLVDNCDIPVHCWYGDDDPQVPPDSMLEIRERFTNINYHRLENAGQLLLFVYWQTVLTKALEYLE